MLLSGAMNLIFGLTPIYNVMFLAWTFNGLCQSTGWAPILKVLSSWYTSKQRRKAVGIYATSYVGGNALTWILTGWLVATYSWRVAFFVPGVMIGIFGFIWFVMIRDTPKSAGFHMTDRSSEEETPIRQNHEPDVFYALKRFWPLVLAAMNGGMLLFALIIWAPTYFVDVHGLGIEKASFISTFFPVAGIIGTLSVSWLTAGRFYCKETGFAAVAFVGIGLLLLILSTISNSLSISVMLLILIGSALYGVDTIITTILPSALSDRHEISTVAGLIDFAFNIGASLAGVLIGSIVDTKSWLVVFIVLAVSAFLTSFFLTVFAWWRNYLGRQLAVDSK